MNQLTFAIYLLLITACGKAPDALNTVDAVETPNAVATVSVASPEPSSNPSPEPSPSPSPAPTNFAPATFYDFNNSPGICNALKNLDTATTTVEFGANSGNNIIYNFGAIGVTITDVDSGQTSSTANSGLFTIIKTGVLNAPPVCTITVSGGQLVSVE